MRLTFFCPRWGCEDLEYNQFFDKALEAGYSGVEFSLPLDITEKSKIIDDLNRSRLLYIAQHWETNTRNFEEHKKEYQQRLIGLTDANPYFINAHTGKDYFTFEQNAELIAIANDIAEAHNVKIIHETHRGRFNFAAHITAKYFRKLPELKITFDLSHWCNVAESFLEDQPEAVALAIERAEHIHARVGFPEGPQIPDPRADEWQEALAVHVAWWREIVEQKRQSGAKEVTITPEFGPYPYMQIMPHTKIPISNQWEINAFMMSHLRNTLQ